MRAIYKDTEIILKVIVASIKTSQKKTESPEQKQSKSKNLKPKNNEQ